MTPLDIYKQRFIVGSVIFAAVAMVFLDGHSTQTPYPSCDNEMARTELAKLYDNKRLLHAIEVRDFFLLNDTLSARYCAVKVKWGDGSVSDVKYEFDRSGHTRGANSRVVGMWTDYNDGVRGPSFVQ